MRSVGMDPRSRLLAAFLPGLVAIVLCNPVLGEAVELHDSPRGEAIVPASETRWSSALRRGTNGH